MPNVRMRDGSVIEMPDGLDREAQVAFLRHAKERREMESLGGLSDEEKQTLLGGATGPGAFRSLAPGILRGGGRVLRTLTNPALLGAGVAGLQAARGRPATEALGSGALVFTGGRGMRIAQAGNRWAQALERAAERFGRITPKAAEVAEAAVDIPGRTLTKASSPPFLPKGKVRLDLGPTEQTTMTGTVGTSRPPTPKPISSSTGAVPKGKVSQPNVSVRTEAVAPKAGPAAAGKGAESFGDEVSNRIRELAREGRSRADIARRLQSEFGATPGQSATAMDAILRRGR